MYLSAQMCIQIAPKDWIHVAIFRVRATKISCKHLKSRNKPTGK